MPLSCPDPCHAMPVLLSGPLTFSSLLPPDLFLTLAEQHKGGCQGPFVSVSFLCEISMLFGGPKSFLIVQSI